MSLLTKPGITKLSELEIDAHKDWATKKIENLGAPDSGDDAKRHDSAPKAHKTSHQNGGADEISLAGLDGEPSTLTTHAGLPNVHHTPPGDGDLAPKAHKDSHDPQDGSDPLDAAAPVKVGAANAEGSSHSFARADHVHEREHAIYTHPTTGTCPQSPKAHAHTGAVAQSWLKTTTGSVQHTGANGGNYTLPGGQYAFYPQTRGTTSGKSLSVYIASGYASTTSFVTVIHLSVTTGDILLAQSRYIQASPPYELDHFIYLLMIDGKVKGVWEAPDPPWYGQGFNGEATEEEIPHPFADYFNYPDLGKPDSKVRIVLVNPVNIAEIIQQSQNAKKSISQIISEGYNVGSEVKGVKLPQVAKIVSKGVEFRILTKR